VGVSLLSPYSSAVAGGACLFIRHEFLLLLEGLPLFICDTSLTVIGECGSIAKGARENTVSLYSSLESRCAWDGNCLLFSFDLFLQSPERSLSIVHRLLCWCSILDSFSTIIEGLLVLLEALCLYDIISLIDIDTVEF